MLESRHAEKKRIKSCNKKQAISTFSIGLKWLKQFGYNGWLLLKICSWEKSSISSALKSCEDQEKNQAMGG